MYKPSRQDIQYVCGVYMDIHYQTQNILCGSPKAALAFSKQSGPAEMTLQWTQSFLFQGLYAKT